MIYHQIERSGSTQAAYGLTPQRVTKSLAEIKQAGGQITPRPDLLECVKPLVGERVCRVLQVRFSTGCYAGTAGQFFAGTKRL